MAQLGRNHPETSHDPDGPAHDRAMAQQRAHNARQEAEIYRKYANMAEAADHVNAAAGLTPALVSGVSGDANDLRAAATARKVTGEAGKVLAPIGAATGYVADRKQGVPRDEATIRNVGGGALGVGLGPLAIAAAGELLAPEVTPLWAKAGLDTLGGLGGAWLGDQAAKAWHDLKDRFAYDPYWQDKVHQLTSPTYLLERRRRGQ